MSEAGAPVLDPIHQFHVKVLAPLHIFGINASFTNASLFMVIAALAVVVVMLIGTSGRSIVPSRLQTAAEWPFTNSPPTWCARPPAKTRCASSRSSSLCSCSSWSAT